MSLIDRVRFEANLQESTVLGELLADVLTALSAPAVSGEGAMTLQQYIDAAPERDARHRPHIADTLLPDLESHGRGGAVFSCPVTQQICETVNECSKGCKATAPASQAQEEETKAAGQNEAESALGRADVSAISVPAAPLASSEPKMPSAHDHGNCDLCDWQESTNTRLAERVSEAEEDRDGCMTDCELAEAELVKVREENARLAGEVERLIDAVPSWVIRHADEPRWRTLDSLGMPEWTDDEEKALCLRLREHADAYASDDPEDVRIVPVSQRLRREPGGADIREALELCVSLLSIWKDWTPDYCTAHRDFESLPEIIKARRALASSRKGDGE